MKQNRIASCDKLVKSLYNILREKRVTQWSQQTGAGGREGG
jgi:hypothetical protein